MALYLKILKQNGAFAVHHIGENSGVDFVENAGEHEDKESQAKWFAAIVYPDGSACYLDVWSTAYIMNEQGGVAAMFTVPNLQTLN